MENRLKSRRRKTKVVVVRQKDRPLQVGYMQKKANLRSKPNYFRSFKYRSLAWFFCILLLINGCTKTASLESNSTGLFSPDTNNLNIWWEKGFNLEEDEAFLALVHTWEKQTNQKVKLSFYTISELAEKADRALQGKKIPDILMSQKADLTLYPRLAWQGKLTEVDDLIQPVQNEYTKNALKAATYYNNAENKIGFYGVPLYQTSLHIFYWQKLLASIELESQDIPEDWDGFWQFWQQAQNRLRAKQVNSIYGLGLPLSSISTDTFFLFEQILEAHNISLLDSQGKLIIDRPQIRQDLIDCLRWYQKFYQQGYIPLDAVDWVNTDNNRQLLNRVVLMTPNATLSIPASLHQDGDTYYQELGIVNFPRKPNGEPMRYLVSVKQAVILADSPHQQEAKAFIRYLMQPQTIAEYLKASGNRYLPVHQSIWQDPFWQKTQDPYLTAATKVLTQSPNRLISMTQNPAYSQVLQENIWGQAIASILVENITPEEAVDRAITRIKQIFAEWEEKNEDI